MGFRFDLLLIVAKLNLGKSRMPFVKGQGWHFNPFQLHESGFTFPIVIGLTISAFDIPNSQFNYAIPA